MQLFNQSCRWNFNNAKFNLQQIPWVVEFILEICCKVKPFGSFKLVIWIGFHLAMARKHKLHYFTSPYRKMEVWNEEGKNVFHIDFLAFKNGAWRRLNKIYLYPGSLRVFFGRGGGGGGVWVEGNIILNIEACWGILGINPNLYCHRKRNSKCNFSTEVLTL